MTTNPTLKGTTVIEVLMKFNSLAEAAAALAQFQLKPLATAVSAEEKGALLGSNDKADIVKQMSDPKPKAQTVAKVKAEAPAPTPPSAATAQTAAPAETEAATTVDYPTLQKAVFKLAGVPGAVKVEGKPDTTIGRQACTQLLESLGVATFKELPADKWQAALNAVEGKYAELQAA